MLNLGKHREGEKMALLTEPRGETGAQFLSTELWGDKQLPPNKSFLFTHFNDMKGNNCHSHKSVTPRRA